MASKSYHAPRPVYWSLYDTISVNDFYRNQPEINDAISKAAKAKGADSYLPPPSFYRADAPTRVVQSPNKIPANSEAGKTALAAMWKFRAALPQSPPNSKVGRFFETQSTRGTRYTVTLPDGTKIQEVNNITAAQTVPFDAISFTGHFNSSTDISTKTTRRAAKKGAKFYHITHQWQQNQSGSNLTITPTCLNKGARSLSTCRVEVISPSMCRARQGPEVICRPCPWHSKTGGADVSQIKARVSGRGGGVRDRQTDKQPLILLGELQRWANFLADLRQLLPFESVRCN